MYNIQKLLLLVDLNEIVIEMDNHICELCAWGDDLENLTEPQLHFYYNQELEREINNGGFGQYFYNSAGAFAHQTVLSLELIGATKTARILQEAIDQFPDKKVPTDQMDRHETLEQITEQVNDIWEELEQKFFLYEDDLNTLNIEFVRRNIPAFSK